MSETPSSKETLIAKLAPVIELLDGLDPAKTEESARLLNERLPIDGELMTEVAALFEQGVAEGWLCDRSGGPGVTYSRLTKKQGKRLFSVDAVRMNAPGLGHVHTLGEFDLCFPVEGDPKFDDRDPGWCVYEPESWHVPTVSGGTMNIFYFLPEGAIKFDPIEKK